MKTREILLIIALFIKIYSISSQEISCVFINDSLYWYRCNLTIQNPNGFNNFSEISGRHLAGMTNTNVHTVLATPGSNSINIPSIVCDRFINAWRIEFTDVGIEKIDEDSFKNCGKLVNLVLRGNKIREIDERAFLGNLELGSFIFDRNQLSVLPEKLFANQQKLASLMLTSNNFEDFPKNLFNPLANLNYLALFGNKIKNLRIEWFENITNLKSLLMHTNQIEELPKNIFNSLTKLSYIDFNRNLIKVLKSESFGISPNLTDISFSMNKIEAIDEEFINKVLVTNFDVMLNVCVNDFINDVSVSRDVMRARLKKCFDNYEILISETTTIPPITTTEILTTTMQTLPPGCMEGSLNERICLLEEMHWDLTENVLIFREQTRETQRYLNNKTVILASENKNQTLLISNIQVENKQLVSRLDEMQETIEDLTKQNESINEELASHKSAMDKIQEENQQLRSITEDLQEKLEKQTQIFAAALEELENKFLVLSTRPCAC